MKWFVRGDIDGFFGLALDNLVQMLLIGALCRFVLGFSGRLTPPASIPWRFTIAYLLMAACFFSATYLTEESENH